MFCPKCGAQIANGAAFCPKCGAKLGAANVAMPASSPVTMGTPAPVKPGMSVSLQSIISVACAALAIFSAFMPWATMDAATSAVSNAASLFGVGASFQKSYTLAQFSQLSSDWGSYRSMGVSGGEWFMAFFVIWLVALFLIAGGAAYYLAKRSAGGKRYMLVGLVVYAVLAIVCMMLLGSSRDFTSDFTGELVCLFACAAGIVFAIIAGNPQRA